MADGCWSCWPHYKRSGEMRSRLRNRCALCADRQQLSLLLARTALQHMLWWRFCDTDTFNDLPLRQILWSSLSTSHPQHYRHATRLYYSAITCFVLCPTWVTSSRVSYLANIKAALGSYNSRRMCVHSLPIFSFQKHEKIQYGQKNRKRLLHIQ